VLFLEGMKIAGNYFAADQFPGADAQIVAVGWELETFTLLYPPSGIIFFLAIWHLWIAYRLAQRKRIRIFWSVMFAMTAVDIMTSFVATGP
jgi:hypothetical protein